MLPLEKVSAFRTNGFIKGARVLGDTFVDELRDEVDRVIREVDTPGKRKPVRVHNLGGADENPVWQIVNIWEASNAFHRLINHPIIAEEVAQLTGATELRIWHDQIQYKPAAKGGVNMWHQDSPLWPILRPMTQVSAWVALDDVDLDNGCMSMVTGSHKWGDQIATLRTWKDYRADVPDDFKGNRVEVKTCPVAKGEVHFHHGLTWHGSHANKSGRPRRAIALHYMTGETRFVAERDHIMKKFVEVADGELMDGPHFPKVWPVEDR